MWFYIATACTVASIYFEIEDRTLQSLVAGTWVFATFILYEDHNEAKGFIDKYFTFLVPFFLTVLALAGWYKFANVNESNPISSFIIYALLGMTFGLGTTQSRKMRRMAAAKKKH